jgi:ATP-dependent RNA circularization protein (DNA/RNA ligase family)
MTEKTASFIKYPKIRIIGHDENRGVLEDEIIIEEKFDGFNARIYLGKDKIIFGSRNRELEETDEKQFTRFILYIKDKLKDKQQTLKNIYEKYGTVILFGEGVVRHTIGYDFERLPPYLGFDVYELNTKTFMDREDKVRIFENLGLEPIKLVFTGKIGKKDKIEVPKSAYYNGQAEGVVIKNFTTQLFAKIVREEFKETNREVFGNSKKFATNDTEYFISVYCTNARIEKIIFKLIDDGNKLDMRLMTHLPKQVYSDIWEEEWNEIFKSSLKLDLKGIRKKVASRCLNVLQQMITNNAL